MKNKPKILIFLLFLVCSGTILSQSFTPEEQRQIDSLNTIVNNPESHDTSLAGAYVGLSNILYVSNLDTMITLCQKAKEIIEKAMVSHLDSSSEISIKDDPILLALSTELAGAFNNIGLVHYNRGNIPLALEYFHKSLKIQEEISFKEGMAYSYNNIGFIYDKQGEFSLALEYYHKSLEIDKEFSDKKGMADSYNNIGGVHADQGDLHLAHEYFQKSLKIQEVISDKKGMASTCHNIGNILCRMDSIENGIKYLKQGLKLAEEIGDKHGVSNRLVAIGRQLLKKGQVQEARKHGQQGLKIAREIGSPDKIRRNAGLLSKVAKRQNNYREALEMRNLEIKMRDSIASEEAIEAAAKQQAKYEYEKEQAIKDKEHEKQMALSVEREEKQKVVSYSAVGASFLLVAFLVFVFNRLKVTRKQKTIIESTHRQLAEHHKEIQDSIKYAKRIQEAILPPMSSVHKALKDGFVLYKPKDVVAGDFYWLEQYDNKIYFAAADCTGHGVPGAMVSVVCSHALSKALLEENYTETGKLLDRTRELVIERLAKGGEEVKDGMDISLCALTLPPMGGVGGGLLQWSGANNPLWIIRSGELIEYKHDKQAIGIQDNAKPFTTHNIELQKDDRLYINTDGYQDQFGGPKGKKLKPSRLRKKLLAIQDQSMEEQKVSLDKEFEDWKGEKEQIDDVCVIGVKV